MSMGELDAKLRRAADIVSDEDDDSLIDHVVMLYTREGENADSWLALRTTSHMPRWVIKGLLVDALDMVRELDG